MFALPDPRPYRPLEFQDSYSSRMRRESDMKCVWVGIAAIVIIYLMNHNMAKRPLPAPRGAISGMLSRIQTPIRAVSSRIQRALVASDMIDACEVWPEFKCGMVSLIDVSSVKKSMPPPRADDATKQKNYAKLLDFVKDKNNAKACIIIFAHWCPHCKTLLKELVDQTNSGTSGDHKYLLVNGESVASEAFAGDDALVDLKHYPTILCKLGNVGKEASSLSEAKTILENAEVKAEEATESPDKEEEEAPAEVPF